MLRYAKAASADARDCAVLRKREDLKKTRSLLDAMYAVVDTALLLQ